MGILVTGGAGYIGSHAAHALVARGERVVVLDNLSTGVKSLAPKAAHFELGDVGDPELLRRLFKQHQIDAVMHFAASIIVPESIEIPLKYYSNNVSASRNLIASCVENNVEKFVFSSTAAVYGIPSTNPINETAPTAPINPYGRSKLAVEWMLEDASTAHDLRYVALRYFNVAAVDPGGLGGQPYGPSGHLIRRAAQLALGRLDHLDVFGTDHPTPDGSPVRDFIHVSDLVDAHILALESLRDGAKSSVFNCGYGTGSSVFEVIEAFEKIVGRPLRMRSAPRRSGDPSEVIADSARLRSSLGWVPKLQSLDAIARSAFEWERNSVGLPGDHEPETLGRTLVGNE
ncbi:MAG TPA: UDP-glucose 4-epimerase GalE [Rhizomicrobium sp.]|jgi:UDP-glucose 4-epimerase